MAGGFQVVYLMVGGAMVVLRARPWTAEVESYALRWVAQKAVAALGVASSVHCSAVAAVRGSERREYFDKTAYLNMNVLASFRWASRHGASCRILTTSMTTSRQNRPP